MKRKLIDNPARSRDTVILLLLNSINMISYILKSSILSLLKQLIYIVSDQPPVVRPPVACPPTTPLAALSPYIETLSYHRQA